MKIIVDENIPYGVEAFETLGDVVAMPGRAMTPPAVRDADALIVRSVTKVDRELLDGSRVRFVATATIGFDHVDVAYLRERDIGFASAPGSNANSVAEYVTAALLVLAGRKGLTLEGKTIGVIGVGNVGSRVVKKAEALGLRVLQNDPPLRRATGDGRFRPLNELLSADIITLHVPLSREGEDRTFHLVNEAFLAKMKKGSILINTSRGPVVETEALRRAIEKKHLCAVALDVWENEPEIDADLLPKVDLATPHIAGYSFDGKVAGTVMVHRAACKFFRADADWDPAKLLPAPPVPAFDLHAYNRSDDEALGEAARVVYDIQADDARLRKLRDLPADQQGDYFDNLRKEYPVRREFHNTEIHLEHGTEALKKKVEGIGFQVRMHHP